MRSLATSSTLALGSPVGILETNNKLEPEILTQSIELPAELQGSFLESRYRQLKSDAKITFFVFTFLGFGLAGIARSFWFSHFPSVYSAGFAVAVGILASLGILFLHNLDFSETRKELKSGECLEAMVSCKRAMRVRLSGSSLEGVALDCGDDVLVLIGDWWLNDNRSDIWMVPNSRKRFPAWRFRIQFLPGSGKVLAVHVEGGTLSIEKLEPIETIIELRFSKYSEVVHAKQSLKSMMRNDTVTS